MIGLSILGGLLPHSVIDFLSRSRELSRFDTGLVRETLSYAQEHSFDALDVLNRMERHYLADESNAAFEAIVDPQTGTTLMTASTPGSWAPARDRRYSGRLETVVNLGRNLDGRSEFDIARTDAVEPYIAALHLDPQVVYARLERRYLWGKGDRKPSIAIIDPVTAVPLMVTNEKGEWQPATLKEFARHGKLTISTELKPTLEDADVLKQNFTTGVISSVWRWIQPAQDPDPNRFSIEFERACLSKAARAGLERTRMNAVITPHRVALPDWLTYRMDHGKPVGRDEMIGFMTAFIKAVMPIFKGKIKEYVVVNEPFNQYDEAGRLVVDDQMFNIIGEDWVEIAFQAAREADPGAILILNQNDNNWLGGGKTASTRDTVQKLAAKGLVDKVGLQMHVRLNANGKLDYSGDEVTQVMQSMGIPCVITEMDVDLRAMPGTEEQRFLRQAQTYHDLISASLASGVCFDIGFWGTNDRLSWLEDPQYGGVPNSEPDLWDGKFNPKAAYYSVLAALYPFVMFDNTENVPLVGRHPR